MYEVLRYVRLPAFRLVIRAHGIPHFRAVIEDEAEAEVAAMSVLDSTDWTMDLDDDAGATYAPDSPTPVCVVIFLRAL